MQEARRMEGEMRRLSSPLLNKSTALQELLHKLQAGKAVVLRHALPEDEPWEPKLQDDETVVRGRSFAVYLELPPLNVARHERGRFRAKTPEQ